MTQLLYLFNLVILNDAAEPWQLGFQDSAAPGFTGLVTLHDSIGFYLILIGVSVFWILFSIIYYYNSNKNPIAHKYLDHGTILELVWTITPALVLIAIAFPSFRLLYIMDEVISPTLTIKVVGFLTDGLKSEIFSKIKDTYLLAFDNQLLSSSFLIGQKNIINLNIINKYSKTFFHFHSRCRAINRIGPHNKDVISVLFGLLLGDGYAQNRSGEGVRICIRQSIIHKEYLFFLYHFFFYRGYCSQLEPRKYSRTIKNKEKIYYGFEFNTYTFRSFNWIHDLFYKKGRKVVPLLNDYTEMFFTSLTLAIWICDDGGKAKPGLRISCNAFSLTEVESLSNLLIKKFNLHNTIQKIAIENQYSIYIKSESMAILRKLVKDHMPSSMWYKLG